MFDKLSDRELLEVVATQNKALISLLSGKSAEKKSKPEKRNTRQWLIETQSKNKI